MKKKIFSMMLLLVTIVMGMTSCSDDKNEPESKIDIIGTWAETTYTESGSLSFTTIVEWTFNNNGTASEYFETKMNNSTLTTNNFNFTYMLKSDKLTLKSTSTDKVTEYTISVNGNIMKMGNEEDGYFNLTKK